MAPDIKVRHLQLGDIQNGFLSSLGALAEVGDMGPDRCQAIYDEISSNTRHAILVAVVQGRVVGAITVLTVLSMAPGCPRTAHIEDVAVHTEHQKQGIGALLTRAALRHAAESGCRATVLDCSDEVREFYAKQGASDAGRCMRISH